MLEILITVLFVWLLFKVIGLAFRVAWGAAKIVASILFTLAVPLLVLCLIFAGGMLILIPIAMIREKAMSIPMMRHAVMNIEAPAAVTAKMKP